MKTKNVTTPEQNEEYFLKIFTLLKMMDRISMLDRQKSFNNSEMRMLSEILSAKREGKRLISTQLADRLSVTRSAISQMVNSLEKREVVKRVPDEVDRKIAYIELTEKALAKYEEEKVLGSEFIGEVVASYGIAKFEKLYALAEAFAKTVEKNKDKLKKEDK